MQPIVISRLNTSHLLGGFQNKETRFVRFLQKHAMLNDQAGVCNVFVVTLPNQREVIGFYTLSATSVEREYWPADAVKRLPRYPLPCVLLGQMAVDDRYQGQGIGKNMVLNALERIEIISQNIGIFALIVDAESDKLVSYYAKVGFLRLEKDAVQPHHRLYIPMKEIRAVLAGTASN